METEQIIRLIETVAASSLTEFEYQEGDVRLVLKADKKTVLQAAAPETVSAGNAAQQAEQPEEESVIRSPLVGTFYSAPAEDAQPFVQVGDSVKKGQVIGIIETMKLMNEIECDRDGVIDTIYIENEQVVEYGQPLFRIRQEA